MASEATSPSISAQNGMPGADEKNVLNLTELGLTLAQSRVYLALLEIPGEKAAAIASRAGVSRTKIYEVLETLELYGFVASEGERGVLYRPIPPDAAIPQWLRGRERRREQERERDGELAETLAVDLPSVQAEVALPNDEFQIVTGEGRVNAIFPGIGRRASKTLCIMQMPPFVQPRRQWNLVEAEALSRNVATRILQDEAGLKEPARIKEAIELGAEIRVSDALPIKLVARDQEEAAISLREAGTGNRAVTTGLVIREPGVVEALQAVFEREWQRARAVTIDDAG